MAKQEITIEQARRAARSLGGRRARLKRMNCIRSNNWQGGKSPIAAIDIFAAEVDRVDDSYKRMEDAIKNATVSIEI